MAGGRNKLHARLENRICKRSSASPHQVPHQKILSGGTLGGRTPPVRACRGQRQPAPAGVEAVQGLYGGYRNPLVVHGKEKVYGSIP
jgi:hypothetical protein